MYSSYYDSCIGKIYLESDGVYLTILAIEGQPFYKADCEICELEVFTKVKKTLDAYFKGDVFSFDVHWFKPVGTLFQKTVWKLLTEIPYGHTISYGELARQVAKVLHKDKMSAQAVGQAVGHNPIAILIPCHRVVGRDGNLTGYAGGVEKKQKLLELEGVNLTHMYLPKEKGYSLSSLKNKYAQMQQKYGAKELDAICFGGCERHPDLCFVFMNPTGRNIASLKSWHGLKAPWIGTKNVWDLFFALHLIDDDIYFKIKSMTGKEWTEEFADVVYENVRKHKYFITNLGKCTQLDARALPDEVYLKYLDLLKVEFDLIKPKVILLFGNQVSSVVLKERISVSKVRRKCFIREFDGHLYKFYAVYYPVGNGRFNIDKAIADIEWIMEHESIKKQDRVVSL